MFRMGSPMDISRSPCSTQCPDEMSDPVVKTLFSKIISAKNERRTPDEIKSQRCTPFARKITPFNPFNCNLKERLENSVFSPSVFSNVVSPSQDSEEFKWTIEDLSEIKPVHIEEELHCEEQLDAETESEMQKTIDKYFSKTELAPSPWDSKLPSNWLNYQKRKSDITYDVTMESVNSFIVGTSASTAGVSFQHVSTQTCLSFPPDLPEALTTALKPYFSKDDTDENEIDLSLNSLRRKLLFHSDDESTPSPLKNNIEVSPFLNNYFPSTPAIEYRTDGTPLKKFSPLDLSPISQGNLENNKFTSTELSDGMNIDPAFEGCERSSSLSLIMSAKSPVECVKVLDSPRLGGGVIRRMRKRRRYSDLSTNRVTRKSFADTGYQTRSEVSESAGQSTDASCAMMDYWQTENKENIMFASTPTRI